MSDPQTKKPYAGLRGRRRRREPRRKSVAIVYRRDGETVRHIDMQVDQLQQEINRLCDVMRFLARQMRLTRIRSSHPILRHVRYILKMAPATIGTGLTVEQMTQEIGRLNFIMNYALKVMNTMKSQHEQLEEIRFILRFRQTSRKRGPGWNSFNGDHEIDPEAAEPPEPEFDP